MNKLYYENNLNILTALPDNSIDLVYADPPFNTGRDFGAYNDKWENGLNDYIDFMCTRAEQIQRILKDTGSFYLHCDPTASHYLKIMLDQVFGIKNFQNEIVWCYTSPGHGNRSRRFSRKHDTIFLYSNGGRWVFNPDDIRIPYKSSGWTGRGFFSKGRSSNDPYYKQGKVPETWWTDISQAFKNPRQFLKYPTQKPIALLERIIKASSNVGDVVLDPFCGSGTTLDAAHKLDRQWIGIDEGQQAINTTTMRLADQHGILPNDDYELIGETNGLQLPTVYDATPQQTKLL